MRGEMHRKITIGKKYCGFSNIGNGGYVCGMVAKDMQGIVEVTLWKPPPLDLPLDVERDDNKVLVKDGDLVVAEGRSSSIDLEVPDPPTYREAVEASKLSAALIDHPLSPDCFVCGCNRAEGDGLRVFAGPVTGKRIVAAPWVPRASLADNSGKIRKEFLWAVLDCPGAYSFIDSRTPVVVLGRLVADVKNRITPGEKCIVIGWKVSTDGRKYFSGSALFSESGELSGMAKATWFLMKDGV